MAKYALAVRTTNTTTAEAAWEIRAGSGDRPRILEIGISISAATASVFGLGRPGAIGITPTSPVTVLPEDPATSALPVAVASALAWGTKPTVPTSFLRRVSFPATIGAGIIWTFENLIIPASDSLVLWNLASNSAVDAWVVLDE